MADEKVLAVKLAFKAGGYKQEIKAINQNTKVLKSEFDKAKAGSEDFENSLEGQKAKLKLVAGELQNSKEKLNIYNTQMKKCKDTLEVATKAFDEQQKEVESLKNQIKDYSSAYGATSPVVKKLEQNLKDAEKALESKRRAVINADSSLTGMKITINKTEADISKLSSEIRKIEGEISEFGKEASYSEKVLDSFKENIEGTTDEVIQFGAHMSELGQGVMDVGEKVGETGKKILDSFGGAIEKADSFNSSMNDLRAKTGAAAEDMEELTKVTENVYNNNFGESFEEAAESVATVNKYLWLTGDELQRTTEKAYGLKDTFGYDIAESIRSVDMLMDTFGLTSDEAFNLIVQGAQNGLDFSGEMLDTINEYSVQFEKAGLEAEDMFNILFDGAQSGAWNLDKVGDAVKEFNIRLTDGSNTTKEALSKLGMNADDVANTMSEGGDKAKETYDSIIKKIAEMDDAQQQNLVGVGLFGTMWEDLGPGVITELNFVSDAFNRTYDSAGELNEIKYDNLSSATGSLKRTIETGLLKPIGESLLPLLNNLIPQIQGVVDKLKSWIQENPKIASAITIIIGVIGGLLAIIGPIITTIGMLVISLGAMSTAFAAAGGVAAFFSASILPVITVIGAVIGVVATLAMAIYSNWEGIKQATIQLIETCRPQFEAFRDSFNNLWQVIKSIYETVIKPLFKMIGQVIQYCIEFVTPIIQRLLPVFTSVFNAISSFWNNIGKPVFSAIISIIQTIGTVVKPIFDTFRDVICGAMDAVLKPIQWVIDKLSELFGWVGDVGSKIGGFLDKINPFKSIDINANINPNSEELAGVARSKSILTNTALSGAYYQPQTRSSKNIGTMIQSSNAFSKAIGGNDKFDSNDISSFNMKPMEDMFRKMIELLSVQNSLIEKNKPVFNLDGEELSNKLDAIGGTNMMLYGRFN